MVRISVSYAARDCHATSRQLSHRSIFLDMGRSPGPILHNMDQILTPSMFTITFTPPSSVKLAHQKMLLAVRVVNVLLTAYLGNTVLDTCSYGYAVWACIGQYCPVVVTGRVDMSTSFSMCLFLREWEGPGERQ